PREHDDRRRLLREGELALLTAEDPDEFVVDDLHDLLGRVERLVDLVGEGPFAHAAGEVLDDLEGDVRVEQGAADLAHRAVDVRGAEVALGAEVLEGLGEPVGERAEGCHVAPSLRGLPAQYRRAIPRLASTPKTVPHSTIETICHRMTALRDAPNDTIAAEVIWLGRIVWPMMLTPATPYLSKRARSFARRGLLDWAGRPLRTFERTPWAVSTTTSIERTLPTIAAGMATAGWMPPTTPMMAPPYDSTKGTAPAIITPSHWRNAV